MSNFDERGSFTREVFCAIWLILQAERAISSRTIQKAGASHVFVLFRFLNLTVYTKSSQYIVC
jgi:hypothetical protein